MEIRLKIDDVFMEKLKENLNDDKTKQITEDALTLLNWAAAEIKQGRVILSVNKDGDEVKELAMPSLEKIKVNK
jgi:hypothetical protein